MLLVGLWEMPGYGILNLYSRLHLSEEIRVHGTYQNVQTVGSVTLVGPPQAIWEWISHHWIIWTFGPSSQSSGTITVWISKCGHKGKYDKLPKDQGIGKILAKHRFYILFALIEGMTVQNMTHCYLKHVQHIMSSDMRQPTTVVDTTNVMVLRKGKIKS